MLDLETLGTKAGCAILSIGAVRFGDGQILSEFYTSIDPRSNEEIGMTIDISTLQWWMKQRPEALRAAMSGRTHISDALAQFSGWISSLRLPGDWAIWGNGATFDMPVLDRALFMAGFAPLWTHHQERCYRTLCALDPSEARVAPTLAHHALEDARAQALTAMRICPWL
jgi:DNA polymerase III epsilon subunit-like protein